MIDEPEPELPPDARTFRERLRDVAADVSYMEKGGFNAHFKYAFLQEAEVKRAVGAALRRHGLLITHVSYRPLGDPTGQSAVLSCTLTIGEVANDNGEYATFSGVGGGADSSDKAPMKACAAALKYAITSGFLIATGDDPEEDGGTKDKAAPKTRAKKEADAPVDDRQQQLPHVPDAPATSPQDRAATALAAIAGAADRKALTKLSLPLAALSREIPKDVYETVRLAYVARQAALKEAS